MLEKILEPLFHFCVYIITALGYGGVALLMAIESACIPLPSEVIMPFAGVVVFLTTACQASPVAADIAPYCAAHPSMNLWLAALAGAIGCNIGSELAYWVGAKGGRA